MRKIKLFITGLIAFIASSLYAQNQQNKWLMGFGAHAIDHSSVNPVFKNFFAVKENWSIMPPLSKLTLAYSLVDHLSLDIAASVGEVGNARWKFNKDKLFVKAGLGLRFYPFASSWFDPYLRVGANYHKLDYKGEKLITPKEGDFNGDRSDFFLADGGLGVHFWFTEHMGLNVESSYNWVFMKKDYGNFFQHSAGVVFRLGQQDSDKDGIPDAQDECPDIPGLKEFKGCPDSDGDGVPDKDDKCPDVPGLKEFDGCPDSDGDGVPDHLDACPNEAGPKENNGCPYKDMDGDGVLDKDDKCPNVPGLKEFDGCPDSDGDGIPDQEDLCPNEPGPVENNGCPWDEKKEVREVNLSFKNILFGFDKVKILPESMRIIQRAAKVINERIPSPHKLYIDGHTDSVGKPTYNRNLSLRRAHAVVEALVAQGVDKAKLQARGFGQDKPIASNKTRKGRLQNRRVEIVIKNEN